MAELNVIGATRNVQYIPVMPDKVPYTFSIKLEDRTFSMTLNFLAIALAITGILNPVIGALVHNAGSVLVIINSALLLKWRKRK